MSELFSNERLIDYFALIDVEISNIDRSLNSDVFDKLSQSFFSDASPCLKIDYCYKTKHVYPKQPYNDFYTLNFETFFPLMPEERVYLMERPNSSYSFMIPNDKGKCYYVFFYKVYLKVNKSNESISKIKEFENGNISLYAPKYLCFISLHPFFLSFKRLLEEIYINSTKAGKCFKIENILNVLLYRAYLPKYSSTQISFCLGDYAYSFINNKFRTEIGFKLFFSKISIDNAVMLLVSMLLNSIIVVFHSDLEIITPFIYLMTQMLYPLPLTYSVINNLTPDHLELLGFNGGLIAGVYKNDFSDLSSIMKENFNHIVYYDIDQNMLMLDSNEVLREKKIVPVEKMKNLIGRITQILHMKNENDIYGNNTVDCFIRSAFFDFISDIFGGINLDKHILVNEDSSGLKIEFDYDGLLKESTIDYLPLLEEIRNSNSVKAFLANMKSYYVVNKKKIHYSSNHSTFKAVNEDIMLFFKGSERKRRGETTEGLFMVSIINTISLSSPAYEKMSFKQNNIFVDSFHDELFKHSSALCYEGSNGLNLNNYFVAAQKSCNDIKEVMNAKPSLINNSNQHGKPTRNQSNTQSNQLAPIVNQLLFEFKDHLTSHIELLKEFYGLIPNSYLLEALRSSHLANIQQLTNQSTSSIPSVKKSFITPKPTQPSSSLPAQMTKEEYIESFNKVIKSMNFKGEFHLNFATNVIESFCLCPHCSKPNNIWDIRKTFDFSKARRETRAVCKFCTHSYLPFFKTLTAEEVLSAKTKKMEVVHTPKKTEYMAFEHLGLLFSEGEISKKLPANLFNNITLIMGEIKCVIDTSIQLYSIDSFIKENDTDSINKGSSSNNKHAHLISQNSKGKNANKNYQYSKTKTASTQEGLLKKGDKD